jgi:uncharacterized protein with PQ loop repeat
MSSPHSMPRYNHHQVQRTKPKRNKPKKLIDRLVLLAAIAEPLLTVPQAIAIFSERTAAGVSLSTWVGYECMSVIWIWYAIVHRERMILLYQGLFCVVQSVIIVGGLLYGAHW